MQDSVVFQCNISNKHGFQFVNAYVNVWNTPPAILQGPTEEIIVAEGQHTIIPCKSVGAPSPQVSWTRDGIALILEDDGRHLGRHKILPDGSLEIRVIAKTPISHVSSEAISHMLSCDSTKVVLK